MKQVKINVMNKNVGIGFRKHHVGVTISGKVVRHKPFDDWGEAKRYGEKLKKEYRDKGHPVTLRTHKR